MDIEFRDEDNVIVGRTSQARGKIADACDKLGITSVGGWQHRKGPVSAWWVATEFGTNEDYQRVKKELTNA